jgi:glycine/D-amino acid oxidase-like deaminating enzyme
VIGCGVIGLTTALMLQRRYNDGPGTVTIYSKDLPPNTTSNIAGGFWSPTSLFDQDEVTSDWITSFRQSSRAANKAFQLLIGKEYGVRWIDTFNLYRAEMSIGSELPGGNDLYPNMQFHRDPATYFGFPIVRQYSTMMIEPSVYLAKLLRDFYAAGGKLVVREFKTREEIMRLPEPVIFNCTGLGARALFNDEKLIPARGQLAILLPQPEVDYCYLGPGYMFPRSDGIVLGGTFERDNWSTEVSRETTDGFLNSHASIMRGLRSTS